MTDALMLIATAGLAAAVLVFASQLARFVYAVRMITDYGTRLIEAWERTYERDRR